MTKSLGGNIDEKQKQEYQIPGIMLSMMFSCAGLHKRDFVGASLTALI